MMKRTPLVLFSIVVLMGLATVTFNKWRNHDITISIRIDGFFPSHIEIAEGTTVLFVNNDNQAHWPASNFHPTHDQYPEFDPKKTIPPGGKWSFRFTKPGTWYFHDHIKPESGGSITVVPKSLQVVDKANAEALMAQIEKEDDETRQIVLMRRITGEVGPVTALSLLANSSIAGGGRAHVIAHAIGEVSYSLYKENALALCQNDMFNGCTHGLFLTAISDIGFDGLERMIENCKKSTTFQYTMCIHGAGHAFLTLASYDITPALANCDKLLAPKDPNLIHCYNGVFMENVLGSHDGLVPALHPYLSTVDVLKPCPLVEVRYQQACYFNQASWWSWIFAGDTTKIAGMCSQVPKKYQGECADSVGRVFASSNATPQERIIQCRILAPPGDDLCISSMAKAVFAVGQIDESLLFCQSVRDSTPKQHCYKELVDLFRAQGLTEDVQRSYCGRFESEYQNLCQSN